MCCSPASACSGIVFGIVRGNDAGWDSAEVLGVPRRSEPSLLAAFLFWESRAAAPLLPLRLFRDRSFSVANIVGFAFSFGIFGSVFILIQFLQIVQGDSPLAAAVKTMPWTLAPMVVAPLAGLFSARVGTRALIVTGLAFEAIALTWLGLTLSADVSYATLVAPFIVAGVGMGLVFAPSATAVLASMPEADTAKASGTNSTLREVGIALGVAVLTAVFVGAGGELTPTGYVDAAIPAVFTGAAVLLLAVIAALFLPGRARARQRQSGTDDERCRREPAAFRGRRSGGRNLEGMRIGIIGAGALGGTFAVLLERAGHEIQVTARGSGLAAIRADGIRLSGGFGDGHGHPDAAPTLSGSLRPRARLHEGAGRRATPSRRTPPSSTARPSIVVQNGLDGVRTASGLLPDSDCFGALSIIAANYTEPGVVRVTTRAATYLGRGSGPADAASKRWAAVLSEAVPVLAVDDFIGAQWTKLVVNMLNGLPAITGLSVQEIIADSGLRRVLTASMREAVRTGMARGIRFGSLQGLSDGRLRFFSRLPLALGQALPRSMGVRMGSVPNLGSTLQSLRRGQLTEIDFLNGADRARGRWLPERRRRSTPRSWSWCTRSRSPAPPSGATRCCGASPSDARSHGSFAGRGQATAR